MTETTKQAAKGSHFHRVLPGVSLRRAEPRDCDLVFDLILELASFEGLAHEVRGSREELRTSVFCAHPQAEVIVAELRGKAVGFCLFYATYSTFLTRSGVYVEDLYVRPPYRGSGIGTLLLAQVAAIVDERAWGRMEWNVLDWNQSAIDFYRRIGAREVHEWQRYRMVGDALSHLAAKAPGVGARRPEAEQFGNQTLDAREGL